MSSLPDNELDLEKLFLPAWAQQEPSWAKYAHYEGETDKPERERRGGRFGRREGGPGGRREGRGPRPERRPGGAPGEGGRPRAERGPDRRDRGERRGRPGDRPEPRERREPPAPLPEVNVSLLPEEKGVESLARQIKMTGRAYPLFDIAQMILQKPERHAVVFSIKKIAEGQPVQPLFVCLLDDTLWLSEDEAVAHVLRKHFSTFYQAERTPTEPPKGKYTFVAQCGMSGIIFGPPNHHDYQNQLRKLHAERFARMPFDVYKSRVRIVRDEEVVKKWVEDQSWRTEYICLNMPEPLKLPTMEAVEQHFRENHKANILKPVETHTLTGTAARALRSHELTRLVRSVWEDQRRFPLQIATALSQQFAGHGLQFFKVNKTVTHVSVARPHFLDLSLTPVSEGVKRIVDHINANPKSTRRRLLEALAPAPAPSPVAVQPVVETPANTEPKDSGETQAAPAPAAPPVEPGPTPEQTAIIADLHWLIHQGHVIEFANGLLETAKKPVPKPPKPEPKPAEKPAEPGPQTEAAPPAPAEAPAGETATVGESAAPTDLPATQPETPAPTDSGPRPATPDTAAPVAAGPPPDVAPAPASEAPAEPPVAPVSS